MAAGKKASDLNLSEDEVKRITEAFKKEEFRKLFAEYAEEISDPKNRQRYEAEIAQMEAERGMNVKFVRPEPGHVIKTTVNGDTKAFINICKNDHIEKPSSNKQKTTDGRFGLQWSIPHSFAPPREDKDKGGNPCRVFDVVFHPDTYRMAETNVRFRQMLHDTAFDGIERQFELTVDRNNLRFPKIKFKGVPSPTVIRTRGGEEEPQSKETDKDDIMKDFPYPYDNKTTEEKTKEHELEVKKRKSTTGTKTSTVDASYTEPKYTIKHRNEIELDQFRNAPDARPSTRPKELIIEVDLPLLKSAAPVNLDIFEKQLLLKSENPAKYQLDLPLPYPVDDNAGSAKFDKSKKRLIVTLPVLPDQKVQNFFDEIRSIGKFPSNGESQMEGESTSQTGLNGEGKPLIEILSSVETIKPDSNNASAVTTATTKPSIPTEASNNLDDFDEVKKNTSKDADDLKNEKAGENQDCSNLKENSKDIWAVDDVNDGGSLTQQQQPHEQKVFYQLPEFDFDQDVGTLSLVLRVKNVASDSVVKTFGSTRVVRVTFASLGSGGFPIHYSLVLRFEEGCNIVPEDCTVDVSTENVIVLLRKAKLSWSWWDKFQAGVDEQTLQEKYFLTERTLAAELDELGGAPIMPETMAEALGGKQGVGGANPELYVTDLNSDHVTVEIKERDEEDTGPLSPESDIEIIHHKEPPKLHSILKQRSRTTSESSDEVLASSLSRENSVSTTSESPISEVDEHEHEDDREEPTTPGGRKKTVSFSEQVDTTSYKSNGTISALHNTLKSKRRRAKKREEKRSSQGAGGRRRRTSSGGSYSSDDLGGTSESSNGAEGARGVVSRGGGVDSGRRRRTSSNSSDDVGVGSVATSPGPDAMNLGAHDIDPHVMIQQQQQSKQNSNNSKKRGGNNAAKTDAQQKAAHTPPETKREKTNQFQPDVEKARVMEEKDLREKQTQQKEDKPGESTTTASITTKATAADTTAGSSMDIVSEKEVFRDPNDVMCSGDPPGEQPPANIKNPGENNTPSGNKKKGKNKKKKNEKRKQQQQQVKVISDGSQEDEDDVHQTASPAPEPVAPPLRWDDAVIEGTDAAHKTQCAFQFSNSLMFDLDEE